MEKAKIISKIIILVLLILSTLLISNNYAFGEDILIANGKRKTDTTNATINLPGEDKNGKGQRPSDMMDTPNKSKDSSDLSFSDMIGSAENFLDAGKSDQKITAQTAKEKILPIANILVGIATVVFLIVGGYLGLKYMLNGANERAQLKQKLIWFVIAVVVVYGATGIFNIAVNIMTTITGE